MTAAEIAMLSGLAQVVQRIDPAAPLRYLTEAELAAGASTAAYRYPARLSAYRYSTENRRSPETLHRDNS